MANLANAIVLVDAAIRSKVEEHNVPGMAIAIVDRHGLIWDGYYGYANVETKAAITPFTLFEIGSIGKSFTAISLLRLHEQGVIDIHAPIEQYLPWFHLRTEYEPITLHHVMTHTAGFGIGADFCPSSCYEVWSLQEMPMLYPPGLHYRYSNVGYKLLGCLIEAVTQVAYGDILQKWILEPVEMSASDAVTTHDSRKRMAVGYETFYDDRPWHSSHPLVPATWFEYGAGDGSPACTARDLAAYLRMLLNRGQAPGDRVLAEPSFDLMVQRAARTPTGHYGYGLTIRDVDGHAFIGHDGGTIGFLGTMLGDLDEGFGVVILTNGPNPSEKGLIAEYCLRLLKAARHGEPLPQPLAPRADLTKIENADECQGMYVGESGELQLVANDDRLYLDDGNIRVLLERRKPDQFYVNHPGWNTHLLEFGRVRGTVAEAFHGAAWFTRAELYRGPTQFDYPPEWEAYAGHYRSYNPWFTSFRIVLRKGSLYMLYSIKLDTAVVRLLPLGNGAFLLESEHGPSPDRITFDAIAAGKALRATLWNGHFYRSFTPQTGTGH